MSGRPIASAKREGYAPALGDATVIRELSGIDLEVRSHVRVPFDVDVNVRIASRRPRR